MAFDQSTRIRLQKFVAQSRAILTEEFTRQLQSTYGMDPKTGTIADPETLTFLDNQGEQTALILRETLTHYLTTIPGKSQNTRTSQTLDRIIREQAFTVLNRLSALRMAGARGFLIESIANGYSSKGFQLYKNLAGTALGKTEQTVTGDTYRQYLFSLFDEFSGELPVLFDRYSIQGRLFPRESALLALLEQINHFEIEHLWAEDETIGWIYQYFNSQEERKKMRAESQAPRNSRELAVRNQFFTPRYVVEFLTDNTLGRIWYEMTQGKTSLVGSCRYLVRRPNEIFLAKGEEAPDTDAEAHESLSQEELLKQPVYIPFRALKDPRNIRMLDPACGSMHFGLYAFDLFEKIYEEAWQLETELGPNKLERPKKFKPLQDSFADFAEFQKAIPKLIIEHNIHGVDIDPRAVQIAGLSLWQRAHRAWHQMGVKPGDRPGIKKSNIVCAEPMPGEKEMLKEFTSTLHPPVLGQLVETIFDKMELAGEAGTLLKIEEEIASTISMAKDEFNQEILRSKEEEGFLPGMAPKRQPTLFDFAELPDDTNFWDTAEKRILNELKNYADRAESDDGQKRLFAQDAAKGFAFIDLCRKRFDVVLMNPPFGAPADSAKGYLKKTYANHVQDLYCLFIERGMKMSLSSNIGAITSSSFLKYNDYSSFRKCLLNKNLIDELLDLGWGVLDDAYVSAAAYVLSQSDTIHWVFTDYKRIEKKEEQLLSDIFAIHKGNKNPYLYFVEHQLFNKIDSSPFCYSFPADFFKWVETSKKLIDLTENNGIGAGPHNFFFRLHWEVDKRDLKVHGRWPMLPNGGQFSPYYRSNNLVIDWRQKGEFIKEHLRKKYPYLKGNVGIKIQREDMYFREGITYGKKTDRYNAQYMPRNCIPSFEGIAIYPKDNNDIMWILAYLNTRFVAYYLNLTSGLHKNSIYLDRLPLPDLNDSKKNELANRGREIFKLTKTFNMLFETDNSYNREAVISQIKNFDSFKSLLLWISQTELKIATLNEEIENITIADIPIAENIKNEIYEDQGSLYFENANDVKRQALGTPKNFGISDLLADMKSEQKFEFSNFTSKYCIPAEKIFWLQQYLLSLALGVWVDRETKGIYSLGDDTENSLDITLSNLLDMEFKGLKDFKLLEIDDRESISKNLTNNKFFEYHYREYSASNRNAPIYWPLQTPSRSYTIWVYYHRLTAQTLYTCVNDFVDPKLKVVTEDLTDLHNKSTRSSTEEKDLAKLTDLEAELKDFRDELLRIAKFWKPNLNDGVQITAAPLWKLFQRRQWQKKLKETWENLEKGEYDWAHLACSIWPERVLEKCHTDRSLAIAHDVEDDFWEEIEVPVIRRGKDTEKTKQEWQPRKLSETQVRDLIRQIIETGQSSR